jgi:hypothetical protein
MKSQICHLTLVSRFINAQSNSNPSHIRSRTEELHDVLKVALCPLLTDRQDKESPVARLTRLVEASAMLDKVHFFINKPLLEFLQSADELVLVIQTSTSLRTILEDEAPKENWLYCGAIVLCLT